MIDLTCVVLNSPSTMRDFSPVPYNELSEEAGLVQIWGQVSDVKSKNVDTRIFLV